MPVATTTRIGSTITAQQPGMGSTSKRKRRSVTFAPNAQLQLYRCKMIETDQSKYYYNDDDYEAFKVEARTTIEMIINNMEIDEVRHCARGVLCRTPDALRRRMALRVKAWNAVFSEQERQWGGKDEDALDNADAIAVAYIEQCYSSKRLAYTIAKCDEKTVAAFSASNIGNDLVAKRSMDHCSTCNGTIMILNSMSSGVRSSRKVVTSAA
ncbi:hypothetical protein IV203_031361 [Nitzschia inconspicua]|uniref:Uncharacterized protein n=1 Tax=Nitzschia inconspicua TaxID=303405 RepID=A0A9K3LU65_9STRA|nr:hypothetical protein IV203_031361 [Nitzschia inconspicua]